jgi:lipopolysaccharide biosynthesis glycosyltransferase
MKTVVVILSDKHYFHKAKRTILDVRSRGQWTGDIVLITVDFHPPTNFLDYYQIIPYFVKHIDTSELLEYYKQNPILPTCDNREFSKLTQWDKFYVFDSWFLKWDKVIYLDSGLRVFDRISYLAGLDCKNSLMAPDDAAPYDTTKRFGGIIETDRHPTISNELFKEYPTSILQERYFLNCIWMYDTSLLHTIHMEELINAMNKYPICRCNEMTIMNLIFTFKYKVWKPFPEYCEQDLGKRLFGWSEHDRDYGPHTTWRNFCFIKYPFSITIDCE